MRVWEAGDGWAKAMFADGMSLVLSHAFLRLISARDPDALQVSIWDHAGFQLNTQTSIEELSANVRILWLPSDSSELNPVEKLGNLIKDRIGNILHVTLSDLEAVISVKLPPVWHDPKRVRSLIGDGWLLSKTKSSFSPYSPVLF